MAAQAGVDNSWKRPEL